MKKRLTIPITSFILSIMNLATQAQSPALSGQYASRSFSIGSKKFYTEKIRFMEGKDSFYYWRDRVAEGKGTYKLQDNMLSLHFENDHSERKATKNVEITLLDREQASGRLLFATYDAAGQTSLGGASLEITTALGKKLIKSTDRQGRLEMPAEKADFPLQLKASYAAHKPVSVSLDTLGSYELKFYFQPNETEKLSNGEIMLFELGEITETRLQLKEKGEPSFLSYIKL
jgi:hypothetical protein